MYLNREPEDIQLTQEDLQMETMQVTVNAFPWSMTVTMAPLSEYAKNNREILRGSGPHAVVASWLSTDGRYGMLFANSPDDALMACVTAHDLWEESR